MIARQPLTSALVPGPHTRSPAQVGAAFFGLLLVVGNCLLAQVSWGAAAPLFLHVVGVPEPGWYAGRTVGEALEESGAQVSFLVGAPHDGDQVRILDAYAVVQEDSTPVGYRATGAKLHLNSATQAELETLPRVGPALAERIRAGRPYRTVDDLDAVKGIGPATIAALRPFVEP